MTPTLTSPQSETLPKTGAPLREEIARVASSPNAAKARLQLLSAKRVALVTKFRFMGDTLVATPFFAQLKAAYPHLHTTLFTAHTAAIALQNSPALDAFEPMDKPNGQRLHHSRDLYGRLKKGDYDAVFLLNRSFDSAALAAFAGIKTRIGYDNEWRSPFLSVPIHYRWDRNEVDAHLDILRAIGVPALDALPELSFSATQTQEARQILKAKGWSGEHEGRPLLGFQPGANDPSIREWGAERYAEVADKLIEETGGFALIIGGKEERETAERMASSMSRPVLNLAGELPLVQSLAIIGLCDLWIGNDSGLLHSAVAQRVPSVGIFGPNKIARWGYDTPKHRSVTHFPDTPAKDDAAIHRAIAAISVAQVLDTARSVLTTPDDLKTHCAPYFTDSPEHARLQAARRR